MAGHSRERDHDAFRVFEGAAFRIGRKIAETLCHTVKAKFAQTIQCWMV